MRRAKIQPRFSSYIASVDSKQQRHSDKEATTKQMIVGLAEEDCSFRIKNASALKGRIACPEGNRGGALRRPAWPRLTLPSQRCDSA